MSRKEERCRLEKEKFHLKSYKLVQHTAIALLGSAVLAFGLYNIHSISGVTEGGGLGLNLLLQYWFGISPAITNFVFNFICYILGWKIMGKVFLYYSGVSAVGFSVIYKVCEQFRPLWPGLADLPLASALSGAVFVGIGVGLCVRVGGATSGDDALAMTISRITGIDIQWIYLVTDGIILLLSLTYIPVERIVYSLLTVVLSGQIIGRVQKINRKGVIQKYG